MRNFRIYGLCAVAATALVAAGCGGGGNTRPPAPATTRSTPPPPAPENLVDLHGQTVTAGEYVIPAGVTMKVDGVRFSCPAGGMDCTVTVGEDGSATWTGAEAMAALLDDTGNQAFEDLAAALLNTEGTGADMTGESVFDDLRMNRYHDEVDAEDDAGTPDVDETMDNGGGVTTSLTTHEQPVNAGPFTGVSDIAVSVTPTVVRNMESDESKDVSIVDADVTNDEDGEDDITDVTMYDQVRDDSTLMNPVLVDQNGEIVNGRTANFVASAEWTGNPAAEWKTDAFMGGAPMDGEDDFWTYAFDSPYAGQTLPGGRKLHLDLRSDFNPNAMMRGTAIIIATGPRYTPTGGASDVANSPADWADVTFDSMDDVPVDGERDLTTDEMGGVPGSYMGVKGVFRCVDGQTSGAGFGICRINQHTDGEFGVSEGDSVVFVPYMYTEDTDWLSAGVWLTIPDDEEDGDYAIGAFVFGNDPYKPADEAAANSITGTATYAGEAFGRYAEVDGDNAETGRFTADAMLMADFGANDVMGTIYGSLSGFVANGQSEKMWSVNFESANIMMGMDDQDPPQVVQNSALRFDAGASGHARGHGLTGYWNGQFYGSPEADATGDALQPGSAAGTFGLTTERDNEDGYSLTMGGAFAAHNQKEE